MVESPPIISFELQWNRADNGSIEQIINTYSQESADLAGLTTYKNNQATLKTTVFVEWFRDREREPSKGAQTLTIGVPGRKPRSIVVNEPLQLHTLFLESYRVTLPVQVEVNLSTGNVRSTIGTPFKN